MRPLYHERQAPSEAPIRRFGGVVEVGAEVGGRLRHRDADVRILKLPVSASADQVQAEALQRLRGVVIARVLQPLGTGPTCRRTEPGGRVRI